MKKWCWMSKISWFFLIHCKLKENKKILFFTVILDLEGAGCISPLPSCKIQEHHSIRVKQDNINVFILLFYKIWNKYRWNKESWVHFPSKNFIYNEYSKLTQSSTFPMLHLSQYKSILSSRLSSKNIFIPPWSDTPNQKWPRRQFITCDWSAPGSKYTGVDRIFWLRHSQWEHFI